jgi:hypothetical protein
MDGSADFMDACLKSVERGVSATVVDQIIMGTVFDDAATIKRYDPVGTPHRREPVRDDEDGAAARDLRHVLLDYSLTLVIERARRLVENEDARINDERARNRDPLLLPAR